MTDTPAASRPPGPGGTGSDPAGVAILAADPGVGTAAAEPAEAAGPAGAADPADPADPTGRTGPTASPASDPAEPGESSEDGRSEPRDWEWVEEWRSSGEPVPWSLGLTMALFTAVVVGCAVYVVSAGLADRPLIAIVVDVAVAGGVAPAIWLSRRLPVLRWFALGAVFGLVAAWISALLFLL